MAYNLCSCGTQHNGSSLQTLTKTSASLSLGRQVPPAIFSIPKPSGSRVKCRDFTKGLKCEVSDFGESRWSRSLEKLARSGSSVAESLLQVFRLPPEPTKLETIPLFTEKNGQNFQYASDGQTLRMVPVQAEENRRHKRDGFQMRRQASPLLQSFADGVSRAFYRTFVPERVRMHYLVYMKWKFLHRFVSSILQVQCTQAMLQAVGVGARGSLPAAAGLNWVLKDGLGRLGRFAFSGALGSTFDANLKRVRFSTSCVYSLSLGLEMLTPIFPHRFLIFATIANVGKSIALAAYLATSAAIHKSFAMRDNLADVAAKGQVQTVVADNLGLAMSVFISSIFRHLKRSETLMLTTLFPILTSIDLYAIYHELQTVHLQTLNKARLEIIVDAWVSTGKVPSAEEVSKAECRLLLPANDGKVLPLKIGAVDTKRWYCDDLVEAFRQQSSQRYAIFKERNDRFPFSSQSRLVIWLRDGYSAKDAITAILQATWMRHQAGDRRQSEPVDDDGDISTWHPRRWAQSTTESRQKAEEGATDLINAMEARDWETKNILLDPEERQTFSFGTGF